MSKYYVVSIGGGASGLSCAITLGSAAQKLEFAQKKVLVIDSGKSQLKAAKLNNAAGVNVGFKGIELLEDLKQRALAYGNVDVKEGVVVSVDGTQGNFTVKTSEELYEAAIVVFATGMHAPEIEGIGAGVVDHIRATKPNSFMIKNINGVITKGKYVTGIATGAASMYTTAAGLGAQTATDIISSWTDKYVVIHDVNAG